MQKGGDLLVMYTDGVTEAIDTAEEMFSETRLQAVIRQNQALRCRSGECHPAGGGVLLRQCATV